MAKTAEELESKLLEILNQPGLDEKTAEATDAVIATESGTLTDAQRATLATLLDAGLPPPEEILRDAKIAEQNDQIEQVRRADLARRKERREKHGNYRRG